MYPGESHFVIEDLIYEGVKSEKVGCSCFSIFSFMAIFLVLTAIIVIAFLIVSDYNSWQEDYLFERDTENIVYVEDVMLEEKDAVERLILDFSESSEEVDFIELTPYQVGIVLVDSISKALPEGVILDQIHIEPYERKWTIYLKTHNEKMSITWFALEIKKDDRESAVLEITTVLIGDLDLSVVGFGFIVDEVNDGYERALVLVNDSGITGRQLENIELGSDVIVIKGRLPD